jgi:DNA repair protein RecO (recombination protein O)
MAVDWIDDGLVLVVRPHGDDAAVVTLLTRGHGRHAGLVRGALGMRGRAVWTPGNLVQAHWRARLEDHLGRFDGELVAMVAGRLFDDPAALEALGLACQLLDLLLPEREAAPALFEATGELLARLGHAGWAADYVRWEVGLLAELGFALDLGRCALTGARQDLAWVSPRSGRAVSHDAAGQWRERMLALPPFLLDQGPSDDAQHAAGLELTGHFIERWLLAPAERRMPSARHRLLERWRKPPLDVV